MHLVWVHGVLVEIKKQPWETVLPLYHLSSDSKHQAWGQLSRVTNALKKIENLSYLFTFRNTLMIFYDMAILTKEFFIKIMDDLSQK